MKSTDFMMVQNVLALILGILLVMWPEAAIIYLVMVIGAIFAFSGIMALVRYIRHRSLMGYGYPVLGVGSLLLGIWLILAPSFFVNILMYIIGVLVIFGGINLLVNLSAVRKWGRVSFYNYIFPLLIILAGLLVLVNPFAAASIPFIILGICCMVYGIVNIINVLKFRKQPDKYEY